MKGAPGALAGAGAEGGFWGAALILLSELQQEADQGQHRIRTGAQCPCRPQAPAEDAVRIPWSLIGPDKVLLVPQTSTQHLAPTEFQTPGPGSPAPQPSRAPGDPGTRHDTHAPHTIPDGASTPSCAPPQRHQPHLWPLLPCAPLLGRTVGSCPGRTQLKAQGAGFPWWCRTRPEVFPLQHSPVETARRGEGEGCAGPTARGGKFALPCYVPATKAGNRCAHTHPRPRPAVFLVPRMVIQSQGRLLSTPGPRGNLILLSPRPQWAWHSG